MKLSKAMLGDRLNSSRPIALIRKQSAELSLLGVEVVRGFSEPTAQAVSCFSHTPSAAVDDVAVLAVGVVEEGAAGGVQ